LNPLKLQWFLLGVFTCEAGDQGKELYDYIAFAKDLNNDEN
jgi:hypothetical protein